MNGPAPSCEGKGMGAFSILRSGSEGRGLRLNRRSGLAPETLEIAVLVYGGLAAAAVVLSMALHDGADGGTGNLLVTAPRGPLAALPSLVRFAGSLVAGALVAWLTVRATAWLVGRSRLMGELQEALRPAAAGAHDRQLFVLALASGACEELLFRGVLLPVLGIVGQALLFGLVHQVRGRARLLWMTWAAVMGLLFGGLFVATGHLAGAMVAHVAINAVNLRLLRDRAQAPDPGEPPPPRWSAPAPK